MCVFNNSNLVYSNVIMFWHILVNPGWLFCTVQDKINTEMIKKLAGLS